MSWLRSRRFYAGMMAGLVPFLFMAAYSSSERGEEMVFHEGERVVVYALPACCQDADYAQSLKDLLARLPSDAVVLEAPTACSCTATGAGSFQGGFSPSGGGLRDTVVTRRTIVPREYVKGWRDIPPPTPELADLYPMPFRDGDLRMPEVQGVMIPQLPPPPVVSGWIGLLAVPLVFLAGGGGDQPSEDAPCLYLPTERQVCPPAEGAPTARIGHRITG
jgi:hypothetical protein